MILNPKWIFPYREKIIWRGPSGASEMTRIAAGVNEMGTILLIESDEAIQRWIQKFLAAKNLEISRSIPANEEDALSRKEEEGLAQRIPVLEEVVGNYLKAEVNTGIKGGIYEQVIGRVEKTLIGIALKEEKGNQVRAARRLGIDRHKLRKKMKDLQITTRLVAR